MNANSSRLQLEEKCLHAQALLKSVKELLIAQEENSEGCHLETISFLVRHTVEVLEVD